MKGVTFQIPVTGAAARLVSRAASRHKLDASGLGEFILDSILTSNPGFAEETAVVMVQTLARAESGHVTTAEEIREQDRREQARYRAYSAALAAGTPPREALACLRK